MKTSIIRTKTISLSSPLSIGLLAALLLLSTGCGTAEKEAEPVVSVQTTPAERETISETVSAFKAITNCPVIVNTSFNVRGEPIVCTPEDAFRCFMGTEIEALAIGNCLLRKERQNPALKFDYRDRVELD